MRCQAVGAWTGKAMNVIVFPTGDIMSRMIKMVEQNPDSLVILVNPQWALSQQVIPIVSVRMCLHYTVRIPCTRFRIADEVTGDF
jgi:hypothetical protein